MDNSSSLRWLAFRSDMNADGQFTLTDVWLWVVQLFFVPGDAFLWLLLTYLPGFASFLELSSASYDGLFTAIVSITVWLFAIVLSGVLVGAIRDFDRAITAAIARAFREMQRRRRVMRTWVVCQARRLRATLSRRRDQKAIEVDIDELDLDELDLEVLRSHALLAPGFVLSVNDLSVTLDLRRARAQELIKKLEKLTLLQRAFADSNGAPGYRLTQPGRFVLMAKSRISGD